MSDIRPGYSRVSEVISIFGDFSGIPRDILENKKNIGIRVHEAINEYMALSCISQDLEDQDVGYFESWKEWYESNGVYGLPKQISNAETRLYDEKRMITGCIDGIWEKCGRSCLIDWKTSASENKLTWQAQAALYLQLIRKNKLCDVENQVIFLKLDKNGGDAREICYEISEYHFIIADWAVKQHRKMELPSDHD